MTAISWKDVLHYGGALGMVLLGLVGLMFPHLVGVHIDPMACFMTAAGIFGAGLKGGWSAS